MVLVTAIAAVAVTAVTTEAQTDRRIGALEAGRRSVAFALPQSGGGEFAVWRMASDTRNRGILVRLAATFQGSDRENSTCDSRWISLAAGPSFRRYLTRIAPVAPFVQTSALVGASYTSLETNAPAMLDSSSGWATGGEIGFGIGAEWFPHDRVSVAGHTGAQLTGAYRWHERSDHWQVGLETFTSALALHLYF